MSAGVAQYVQLASVLRPQITHGALAPGQQLPTVANLADLVRRNLEEYGLRVDMVLLSVTDEYGEADQFAHGPHGGKASILGKHAARLPASSVLHVLDAQGLLQWSSDSSTLSQPWPMTFTKSSKQSRVRL